MKVALLFVALAMLSAAPIDAASTGPAMKAVEQLLAALVAKNQQNLAALLSPAVKGNFALGTCFQKQNKTAIVDFFVSTWGTWSKVKFDRGEFVDHTTLVAGIYYQTGISSNGGVPYQTTLNILVTVDAKNLINNIDVLTASEPEPNPLSTLVQTFYTNYCSGNLNATLALFDPNAVFIVGANTYPVMNGNLTTFTNWITPILSTIKTCNVFINHVSTGCGLVVVAHNSGITQTTGKALVSNTLDVFGFSEKNGKTLISLFENWVSFV